MKRRRRVANKWARERFLYRMTIILLIVGFSVFFRVTNQNYNKVIDTNEELIDLIDRNREQSEAVTGSWEEKYLSLQSEYAEVLKENIWLYSELEQFVLPTYTYSEEEVELLAKCVQCEAGVNNEEAQRKITSVILNRVKSSSFENTIEGVIYEVIGSPQFSVAYDGSIENCTLSPKVLVNVYHVLVFGNELPDYVCYFYSASLEEDNWVKTLNVYDTVEGTVFAYKKGE